MILDNAIKLIKNDKSFKSMVQTWADLGCGAGLFTNALAHLLTHGSLIYAVDSNRSSLNKIPESKNITIKKMHNDFTKDMLPDNLDGILMANSFHFVKDKNSFIKKVELNFKSKIIFLIVEYDTDKSNLWVPFPLSFNSLKIFFEDAEYSSVIKLNSFPSIYRRADIYSALIEK
jgi:SAM-dependent methyltransferase